jgi:hypothetical protein
MTEKIYRKALEYKKRGWIIHPLSSPNSKKENAGKRPIIKNWQERTKNALKEIIKEWFLDTDNNIGLQCGKNSKVTAIDFDSYLFRDEMFEGLEINTLHSERIKGKRTLSFSIHF